MGLDDQGLRFLLYASTRGVRFTRTAMIGRQELHLSPASLSRALLESGFSNSEVLATRLLGEKGGYAEPLLALLGAAEIRSFDAARYEGATDIHDFNQPIDPAAAGRFSLVLDSGSLEHVFNFPIAIANCMALTEVGGHFVAITPANNWCGHGFYQFSPELFFRVLCPENGFRVEQMIVAECPDGAWLEVADPARARERVTLVNRRPTYLLVIARRVEATQQMALAPQQSDYLEVWSNRSPALRYTPSRVGSRARAVIKALVPGLLKRVYRGYLEHRAHEARYDPRHFNPVGTPWKR
jgi:hypothetical protein